MPQMDILLVTNSEVAVIEITKEFGQAIRVLRAAEAFSETYMMKPSENELSALEYVLLTRSNFMVYLPSKLTRLATRANGKHNTHYCSAHPC